MSALVEKLMQAVQWAMIALAVAMLLFPALRVPQVRFAATILMVACALILGWRLHRNGIGHMTLPAIWDRVRRSPQGADLGAGPLDLLSALLGAVVTNHL